MSETSSAPLFEFLDWDSHFFGLRIGRIRANRLTSADLVSTLASAATQDLDCLYFLADIDPATIRLAEENAFHLIDLRVTLVAPPLPVSRSDQRIRPSRPEDIPVLRDIAGVSHTETRFYRDGRFPPELCAELYRVWIEKSCQGYADMVWVAENQGQPCGYITCQLADGEGRIGLIGVAGQSRGLGLGHALVQRALVWFSEQRVTRVTVATQGANARALRVYQAHGFVTGSIQLWYHKWFR